MGIIKRQGLKTSIVNYLGVLLGVIFFNFVFPNLIAKEYLGLIGLLQSLTLIIASIPTLGLSTILIQYYSVWKKNSYNTIENFNAFSIIAMLLSLGLVTLAYVLLKTPITNLYKTHSTLFIPYFYIVIPLVFISTLNSYWETYALVNLRSAVPSFLREILIRLLQITLIFLFIYKIINERTFILSFPIVNLIPFIILIFYSVKILSFKASRPLDFIKKNENVKEQLYYGVGVLFFIIFSTIHNFLDGIILPAYLGLGVLGIYLRPLVLGQMIQVPYRAIALIASPIIREAIVENNTEKLISLSKSVGINLFLIGTFLFTLLISNTDGIFSLLPLEYSIAKNVLFIIGLGRLLDMAFGLNTEIIIYSKEYKYLVALSGIMVVMTIGLNMILIPIYGMIGAALAVSVSLVSFNILKTLFIYKKFHFHCFSKHYFTLSVIAIVVVFILSFIPLIEIVAHHKFLNSCLNIAFKSLIGTLLFLIPTYLLKVSSDFNDFIKLIISGQIFKGGHKMESL